MADELDSTSNNDDELKFFKPGQLIRPLGSLETVMAVGGFYNECNTTQAIWLKSKVPLKKNWVEKALQILSKSIPTLQLCLCRRKLGLWFKIMDQNSIDYTFIPTAEPLKTYEDLLNKGFDMWNGPLWRTCLIEVKNHEEIRDFSYVLMIAVQHCITDGVTNMIICREALRLINAFAGRCQDVLPNYHDLLPPLDTHCKTSWSFFVRQICNFIRGIIFPVSQISYFNHSLPASSSDRRSTRVLFDALDVDQTSALIDLCKKNGVTVNTCLITAANFAFLQASEKLSGKDINHPAINSNHCVNSRPYLPESKTTPIGCYISYFDIINKVPSNELPNFWAFAKDAQAEVRQKIKEDNYHLKFLSLSKYGALAFCINNLLTSNGMQNIAPIHFSTSNMMDITPYFTSTKEDEVEVVDFLRSAARSLTATNCGINFQTLQGKFMFSLDYSQNKMTDEAAITFFNAFSDLLRNLISDKNDQYR